MLKSPETDPHMGQYKTNVASQFHENKRNWLRHGSAQNEYSCGKTKELVPLPHTLHGYQLQANHVLKYHKQNFLILFRI